MLARDYCDAAGRKKGKPIILSHHMLYGLKAGQAKMSKSDPDSAIFMEDSTADVRRKIRGAYCPRTADAAVARDAEMQLAADGLLEDEAESSGMTRDRQRNVIRTARLVRGQRAEA